MQDQRCDKVFRDPSGIDADARGYKVYSTQAGLSSRCCVGDPGRCCMLVQVAGWRLECVVGEAPERAHWKMTTITLVETPQRQTPAWKPDALVRNNCATWALYNLLCADFCKDLGQTVPESSAMVCYREKCAGHAR